MRHLTLKGKKLKLTLTTLILLFVAINVIAIFHSYKFTHFFNNESAKTESPKNLSFLQKISTLVLGVNIPRPTNEETPSVNYETVILKSNKNIECWDIKVENPKGTIIIFHGFSGKKSSMLDKAKIFRQQGFNTFLVDFMGSGGSEGNQTTIGFSEAAQVKSCFDYVTKKGESNIFLYGTSMGSVAIMKAINDYNIMPDGIIIECPFGSMYKTVCARFKAMNLPCFPMAGVLVFWGGVQNNFWPFDFRPTEYAKKIKCPTLLMYGQQDVNVSREEIDEIFANLNGSKELKIYSKAGHENYLIQYEDEWTNAVTNFITTK